MFGKMFILIMLLVNTLMVLDARAEGGSIAGQMIDPSRSIGRAPAAGVGEFGHNDVEDATDAEMRHMKRRQQVFSDIRRSENNKRPVDLLPKANTFRIQGR